MAVSIDSAYTSLKEVEAAWSEEIKRRLAEIDYDMQTREVTKYVDGLIPEFKKKAADRTRKFVDEINRIG